jgi:adenylate cyclase
MFALKALLKLLIVAATAIIVFFIFTKSPLQRFEWQLQDSFLRPLLVSNTDPLNIIAVVDIDDKSLSEQGRWPWPRNLSGHLINILIDDYQVSHVGLDILFPDHSDQQEELVSALNRTQVTSAMVWGRDATFSHDNLYGPAACVNCEVIPKVQGWLQNVPELQSNEVGHITSEVDDDGVVRKLAPIVCNDEGNCVEALGVSLARQVLGERPLYTVDTKSQQTILKTIDAGVSIPLSSKGLLEIPWYDRSKHNIDYLSATDIFEHRIPISALQGRVVLIGSTAAGLNDLIATPISSAMPSIEVHTNLFQAVLNNDFPNAQENVLVKAIVALFLGVLLIVISPLLGSALYPLLVFAFLLMGWSFWVYSEASKGQLWPVLPLILPWFSVVILSLVFAVFEYLKRERKLYTQFSHYVASPIIDQLRKSPDQAVGLEPVLTELTVVFIDIKGFSALSEKMGAVQAAKFVQTVLERVSTVILKHGGTIDKYLGDAVMAFWGAPLASDSHAKQAVKAVAEVYTLIPELRKDLNLPAFDLLTGIDTGTVLVGDIGAQQRRGYTVIGPAVNRAAQYQVEAKAFGLHVLAGEKTYLQSTGQPWAAGFSLNLKNSDRAEMVYPLIVEGENDVL